MKVTLFSSAIIAALVTTEAQAVNLREVESQEPALDVLGQVVAETMAEAEAESHGTNMTWSLHHGPGAQPLSHAQSHSETQPEFLKQLGSGLQSASGLILPVAGALLGMHLLSSGMGGGCGGCGCGMPPPPCGGGCGGCMAETDAIAIDEADLDSVLA